MRAIVTMNFLLQLLKHSCIKQFNALAFAKSKIVNIVEKYSLRGKEFKDYVASFQEDNVIEFPTSKTASRK